MRSRGGLGRAAIGLAISLVALVLVVRSVDLQEAWDTLRQADPKWVALLVVFVFADVLFRTIRWRLLLSPIGRVPYPIVLSSLLVGYLANNVLPARLGEFVRTHDLGDRTGLSRSTILGTIVVERVVDTVVVVSIAAIAILVLSVRGVVASAVLVGLAVTALLVVGIGLGMAAHRLPGAERVTAFLGRWPQVRDALRRLRDGIAIARNARIVGSALFLSLLSWSCAVLSFAAAAQAVGVQPTIGQAALLAAGTNLATAIPAAPGYVGTYELAAVTIAGSVGIPAESALAFAVLIHVTTLLITSIGGAIAYVAGPRGRVARKAASDSTAPPAPAPASSAVPVPATAATPALDTRPASHPAAEPER